jgi:hypothetical protein
MGHMEAISASERTRHNVPEAEKSMPQTSAVGPPFWRPSWKPLATLSQDERRVTDMPRIEKGVKFRCVWLASSSSKAVFRAAAHLEFLRRSHAAHNLSVVGDARLPYVGHGAHGVIWRLGYNGPHLEGVRHGDAITEAETVPVDAVVCPCVSAQVLGRRKCERRSLAGICENGAKDIRAREGPF